MQKALADIPVGKEISSTPPREHWSPLTTNNFAQMTGRSSKGWKGYDYSHVLKPELREKGYTLSIHHDNPHENVGDKRFYKKALVATVKHKGKKIGNTVGYLHDNGNLELATEFASHISPLHRGKGLGVSMYEGVMSHAKNALNGKQVVGGVHSTMASKVHSALAKKHGLEYNPTAQVNDKPTGEYDDKFGAYNYALKSEELNKALADIPVGKKFSDLPPHEFLETVKENPAAKRSLKGWSGYDYSHILKPEHQKAGYSLSVYHDTDEPYSGNYVMGILKHNGDTIGTVHGEKVDDSLELATKRASYINPLHEGKGLGTSMYEGVMAHAKNALGAKDIIGGIHSTSASKVHSAISKKHGMDYEADPTIYNHYGEKRANQLKEMGIDIPDKQKALENYQKRPIGPNDGRFASYQYALKSEHPRIINQIRNIITKSLSKSSVEDTMHEFKEGTLHSGSESGPKVTDKDQAVAIALNQNKKSEHMWRTRPILKSKDADDLDQSAAAYAIKLGDVKRAEDTAYNEYERNHRLDAAAHHYKALGIALAKSHRKAADHHRLAYQGHCQALGINGLESAPRMIMERVRQLTDNEPDRFKSHPADIF